jgi:D-Tyr-tRNAtyr deacylase
VTRAAVRVSERTTGSIGASMQVELVNDGPVTIWIER